ncbi:UDP-N-acetylmuramoyl-tripeptide--D-alanyl-D-alanine ligase [Paenibacillus shirakamiensis]|uniref:UDP-N-acetylmuramoyl-tripeptide--D-alanyl-D- alanine ligase n=1 Tax=Paenibacillus shirakamiensis TaxID=1265935 RepID=UPI00315B1B2E
MNRTLQQTAQLAGGQLNNEADANRVIKGVGTDSRNIEADLLFIPLVGDQFDGHDYVAQVIEKGAGGFFWQEDHGTPPPGPAIVVKDTLLALQQLAQGYLEETGARVIGITGSNGKTTTKDILYAVLSTTYSVHKTQGNFNNHIGLPLTLLSMPESTEIVVLEMGMSGRHEIELLSKLARPETVIITNIGESHLLQLGSREEIARAKLEILAGLRPGGLLVYNGDEPLIRQVMNEPTTIQPEGMNTLTYGFGPDHDDYPTGMLFQSAGTVFTSYSGSDEEAYRIPLLGEHNVINALGALLIARHYDVPEDKIREGFAHLELTSMRIEMIEGISGITILNDAYNASPTSVKAALGVLESMKGYRRKIAVLGDMLELGDREEEYHESIGAFITREKADHVFTYGPLAEYIARGAASHLPPEHIHAYIDKSALIQDLGHFLTSKDIVLFKASRGMKLEEVAFAIRDIHLSH